MTDRIEAIRARHAARLRTRAAKHDGTTQMSTLMDDDMAVLLAELKEARDDATHFEAEYDDAVAQLERMHSWGGLLSLMDEHWPEDVFPDRTGKPDRDTGPRLLAALRRVDRLTKALEGAREDIRERRRVFVGLHADSQYIAALDDAFGLVNNRLSDALAPVAPDAESDAEQVDHAAEHYATTGSDHCWCAE